MWVYIYNAWGREIASQECANADDIFPLLALYSNWDRAYIVAQGVLIDMLVAC